MLEPGRPIEGRRPDRFRPPHCPWRDCTRHRTRRGYRCKREGAYRRACDPLRRIPRFRCPACGRRFSQRSFAASYYMKRPELLAPIAAGLVAGSAHRQIARTLGCAPSTVTRLAARLGRAALLLQAEALAAIEDLDEPVVFDHFVTFAYSQKRQVGVGTAVGQRSWFVLAFDPAPQRGGRRAARRPPLRRPPGPPPPGAVVASTSRVLALLQRSCPDLLTLVSDDHPAYRAAVRDRRRTGPIDHRVFPNPPRGPRSDRSLARRRDREMFAVDLLHKLARHSQAHHRRETIAFARRLNAVVERFALLAVWRNFIKGVSERAPDPTTPAMRRRLASRPWSWADVLSRRRFPHRIALPQGWWKVYRRRWITPEVGRNVLHERRHAF